MTSDRSAPGAEPLLGRRCHVDHESQVHHARCPNSGSPRLFPAVHAVCLPCGWCWREPANAVGALGCDHARSEGSPRCVMSEVPWPRRLAPTRHIITSSPTSTIRPGRTRRCVPCTTADSRIPPWRSVPAAVPGELDGLCPASGAPRATRRSLSVRGARGVERLCASSGNGSPVVARAPRQPKTHSSVASSRSDVHNTALGRVVVLLTPQRALKKRLTGVAR
jgi:hypothetical protein